MMDKTNENLAGIWRSMYRYTSSSRPGERKSEQFMRLKHQGNVLTIESLPHDSKSYIVIRLSLDGDIATGSWHEDTDPLGYYKGAIYHGAIQLILDEKKRHMRGKWLGYGKDKEVNVGPWELTYVGTTLPGSAIVG